MAGLGLPPEYPRVWGIQIGRVEGGEAKVEAVLDCKDDETATTAMMTDTEEQMWDSDVESDDGEDFAAENAPRPPPADLLYGGDGESDAGGMSPKWTNGETDRIAGSHNVPRRGPTERRRRAVGRWLRAPSPRRNWQRGVPGRQFRSPSPGQATPPL